MKKVIKSTLFVLLAAIVVVIGYVGLFTGDAVYYAPCFAEKKESLIAGKTVIFLGSSVTKGFGSFNNSFVDFLNKQSSVNTIKEAVNGTMLIDNGEKSYISRMKTLDKNIKADMFICQLSTNDATKNSTLGEVAESTEISSFDTLTVAGALEYIICYVKETWNCPVAFYTSFKYDDENYERMYNLLMQIKAKYGIETIDFYTQLPQGKKDMVDNIHPTLLCYRDTMTPVFVKTIEELTNK